jgi:outer membrane protein OmpA-like peptidoglycan-associated protein
MWKEKKQTLPLALAVLLGISCIVEAESGNADNQWYVGGGIGISRLEPDTDQAVLYSVDDNSSAGYKLYLGYDWSEKVSIEGYFSDLGEAKISPEGEVSYKDIGVSGLYHLYQQKSERKRGLEAFIKLGLGWMKNDSDLNYEREHASHVMLGLGSGYTFENGFSIRADIDLYDEDSQFFILSLSKRFGGKRQPASEVVTKKPVIMPTDRDGDGILDTDDQCPGTARGMSVDDNGCPINRDSDGDGVLNLADVCPETAEGTLVDEDGCATITDSDGDGVIDGQDQCPGTPAGNFVNSVGCPNQIILEGVTFEHDKGELSRQSKEILDGIASRLNARRDVESIEVIGHTDNRGSASYNQRLSEIRAKGVVEYLVSVGIEAAKMKAMGMGENKPIADNNSEEGRMRNRRVELILISD